MLQVKNLKTYFYASHGIIKAVDGVTFDIRKGEVFGLVGESGSGKTLTAMSVLGLLPPRARIVTGEIYLGDTNLLTVNENHLRAVRGGKVSIVFQEPASSLNPVFTIGEQIMEVVLAHRRTISRSRAREAALEYLWRVHMKDPLKVFGDYPHQLSGGTKQRVMIAMALVNSPDLLILDEPTTALDVTIQSQIFDLLDEIIKERSLSILFISHDFGIIARMCDRVAVMKKGRIVETNDTKELFYNPKDPYTMSLLESVKALS